MKGTNQYAFLGPSQAYVGKKTVPCLSEYYVRHIFYWCIHACEKIIQNDPVTGFQLSAHMNATPWYRIAFSGEEMLEKVLVSPFHVGFLIRKHALWCEPGDKNTEEWSKSSAFGKGAGLLVLKRRTEGLKDRFTYIQCNFILAWKLCLKVCIPCWVLLFF